MTYPFDPEIAAVVPMIPDFDGTDPIAMRAGLSEMIAQLPAQDMTGVQCEDRRIPGGPGDPEVAHSAGEHVPLAQIAECEAKLLAWLSA